MEDSYHHFNCSSVTFYSDSHAYENNEPSEYMTTSNAYNSQFNNNEKYNKNKNDNNLSTSSKENSTIYVDVKGAVKLPDVYKMKKNDRVKDVLKS